MGDQGPIEDLAIGERVLVQDDKATIKYIGEVQNTKGIWIGVRWDDPSRGKHDGSEYGLKLSTHPTGASFVRARKVTRGVCVCAALTERYGIPAEELSAEELGVGQGAGHQQIEMVGFDKLNKVRSQLHLLSKASLFDGSVSHVHAPDCLARRAPRIDELNLARNLLSSWRVVARLVAQLPRLYRLDISENIIEAIEEAEAGKLVKSYQSLRTVLLNRMNYSWENILACATMWPALQELHVCFNAISSLRLPASSILDNVTLLNFEGNPLREWAQLLKIGPLKHLKTLILNDCGLSEVRFPDCAHGEKSKLFPAVAELALSHNNLETWEYISELDKLTSLSELRLLNNPLLKSMSMESARQQFMARIASLKLCNRTPVSLAERGGAEFDYLKIYGHEWCKAGGNQDPAMSKPSAEFLSQHPRYEILIKKYGSPEDSEMQKAPRVLKDSLLALKIIAKDSPNRVLNKKIPATMTVEKVRSLVLRLLKAEPSTLKITYFSEKNPEGPEIELDNDMRLLSFYSVESGDTLVASW